MATAEISVFEGSRGVNVEMTSNISETVSSLSGGSCDECCVSPVSAQTEWGKMWSQIISDILSYPNQLKTSFLSRQLIPYIHRYPSHAQAMSCCYD
jgi:hypothetical protein